MVKLQFAPFNSIVEPGFWHWLSNLKLESLKLSEEPVKIRGSFYFDQNSSEPRFRLDHDQAAEESNVRFGRVNVHGKLKLFNTREALKKGVIAFPSKDDLEDIQNTLDVFLSLVSSHEAPCMFWLFAFADIKKHKFEYQFHFPVLGLPSDSFAFENLCSLATSCVNDRMISSLMSSARIQLLQYVKEINEEFVILDASGGLMDGEDGGFFVIPDPSIAEMSPGWTVSTVYARAFTFRSALTALRLASRRERRVKLVCLRGNPANAFEASSVITLSFPNEEVSAESLKCFGWEKGGMRVADLGSQMDPIRLADSLSFLNLKLMRWQMAPSLDLEKIVNARCLLLGAGTLGTNVARGLLAWGVRNITFVDSGSVAYSNPVRQSLFEFKDCDGTRFKAVAAAEALRRILPTVISEGIVMTIPMPGHGVGGDRDSIKRSVKQLEELYEKHDVIFLLLDSREARWLPTVLGKVKRKIVLNAALGFDSFLVMRHGLDSDLGCYFCTNVSAPGDSSVDRTLDQQCTVTRPGVSFMCSGLVVEMMASILTHPAGIDAPAAPENPSEDDRDDDGCCLGILPHTIRGFLRNYHQFTPVTPSFAQCVACSTYVMEDYVKRGADLVLDVMSDPAKLEQLTGLDKLQAECESVEVWAFSDEESTGSTGGGGDNSP
ncbi:unnamed protein product [Notodromas monacha]|uniref:Ubiquitin-like modifier-activating enzyme ATG7 n=1 Tax=Notodromas monacha TaxID=399045 RepID=A0A7R9BGZ9_9CRUS|nr:unnamed protein product [Notodromas monacha]CAG0915301.1 unnamed protein product [Notodromas monacha]